jgi:hypothetical protein
MKYILRLTLLLIAFSPSTLKAGDNLKRDKEYLRSRVELVNFTALRRAVNDLSIRYPDQYDSESYLAKLDFYEKDFQKHKEIFLNSGLIKKNTIAFLNKTIAFKQSILLKNPAIDFDKILLIRRKEKGNLGLPANWQSNSSISKHQKGLLHLAESLQCRIPCCNGRINLIKFK